MLDTQLRMDDPVIDLPMENDPDFGDIRQYFAPEVFAKMGNLERTHNRNVRLNYLMMDKLGFKPEKPDFMKRNPSRTLPRPPSDSESDDEWAPGSRKKLQPRKSLKAATKWNPPVKKTKPQITRPEGLFTSKPVKKQRKSDTKATVDKFPNQGDKDAKSRLKEGIKDGSAGNSTQDQEDDEPDFLGFTEEEVRESIKRANRIRKRYVRYLNEDLVQGKEVVFPPFVRMDDSRYPKRNIPRVDYSKVEVPDEDHYLFCDDCQAEYLGDCPIHGPLIIVKDKETSSWDEHRCDTSLPDGFRVGKSKIRNAGVGVWATCFVQKGVRFGPYEGARTKIRDLAAESGYAWEVHKDDGFNHYVDAQSPMTSNWMRYVNCARGEEEQNLLAFQYQGQIYYRTITPIQPQTELLVWYGSEYGEDLGLSGSAKLTVYQIYRNPDVDGFECQYCGRLYTSDVFLDHHRHHVHGEPLSARCMVYRCQYCRRCFTGWDQLDLHVSSICKKKPAAKIRANVLDMSAGNVDGSLPPAATQLSEDGQSERTIAPDSSNDSFISEEMMRDGYMWDSSCQQFNTSDGNANHVRIDTNRPYKCTVCSYQSSQSNNLSQHMRSHTNEKPYKCTVCSYQSSQSSALSLHMRSHTNKKLYKCTVCSYQSSQSSALSQHMRSHTNEKPYKCTVCSYQSSYSSALSLHMRTHSKEKPYKCTVCSHQFSRSGNLSRHMRTHTNEKPYKCTVCSYQSSDSSVLSLHMRTHTKEKPYKCTVCSYQSSQSSNLSLHMRTHTNEKPYKCTVCSYQSSQSSHLSLHMRTHTNEKPYKCTV